VRVVARRREGFVHDVDIEGRHSIVVDEPREAGGTDAGPAPTRLLAAGLASCVAITVEMYAERKGWEVGDVEVEVEVGYERYTPTSFDVALRLPAEIDPARRERLLAIAGKCPVHRIVAGDVDVKLTDRVEPL
jgi:putative redox protein